MSDTSMQARGRRKSSKLTTPTTSNASSLCSFGVVLCFSVSKNRRLATEDFFLLFPQVPRLLGVDVLEHARRIAGGGGLRLGQGGGETLFGVRPGAVFVRLGPQSAVFEESSEAGDRVALLPG